MFSYKITGPETPKPARSYPFIIRAMFVKTMTPRVNDTEGCSVLHRMYKEAWKSFENNNDFRLVESTYTYPHVV